MDRPSIDIIISLYAEYTDDLSIIAEHESVRKVYVYRKFYKHDDFTSDKFVVEYLPNVGRCDHTYLYHIITHYNTLADINLFIPGSINNIEKRNMGAVVLNRTLWMHQPTMIIHQTLPNVCDFWHGFYMDFYVASNAVNQMVNAEFELKPCSVRPFGAWYRRYFGDFDTTCCTYKGMFSVSRALIHRRPIDFYASFIKQVDHHSNPEAGHYIERAWCSIFKIQNNDIKPDTDPIHFIHVGVDKIALLYSCSFAEDHQHNDNDKEQSEQDKISVR
jgi:Protein of unknown function (DUF3431)